MFDGSMGSNGNGRVSVSMITAVLGFFFCLFSFLLILMTLSRISYTTDV